MLNRLVLNSSHMKRAACKLKEWDPQVAKLFAGKVTCKNICLGQRQGFVFCWSAFLEWGLNGSPKETSPFWRLLILRHNQSKTESLFTARSARGKTLRRARSGQALPSTYDGCFSKCGTPSGGCFPVWFPHPKQGDYEQHPC